MLRMMPFLHALGEPAAARSQQQPLIICYSPLALPRDIVSYVSGIMSASAAGPQLSLLPHGPQLCLLPHHSLLLLSAPPHMRRALCVVTTGNAATVVTRAPEPQPAHAVMHHSCVCLVSACASANCMSEQRRYHRRQRDTHHMQTPETGRGLHLNLVVVELDLRSLVKEFVVHHTPVCIPTRHHKRAGSTVKTAVVRETQGGCEGCVGWLLTQAA
eukprot:170714-Rhodomonas_salina.5